MSSFGSLQTALSGLIAHRRALDVTGGNVTNANTAGYSRRAATLSTAGAGAVPAIWSRSEVGGNGVKIDGVVRIRDDFLEARALREHSVGAGLEAKGRVLDRVEMAFPEPSDMGLAAQFSAFWGAWDDVANQPGRLPTRTALLEHASTLASSLNQGAAELRNLHQSSVKEISALVSEVNSTALRVAELNDSVRQAVAAGTDANDLMDQRDLLVERLGELVGATTRAGEFGTVDVFVGGSALVRQNRAEALKVVEPALLAPPLDTTLLNEVQIQWDKDSYPIPVSHGEVGGLLQGVNDVIPRYLQSLDGVAASLVSSVNALHQTGHGLDTLADVNLDFFDAAGTTAAGIAISADVLGQPGRIAAAGGATGQLDAGLAQQLAALGSSLTGPDAAYNALVGRLGVETQTQNTRLQIQEKVTQRVDDSRESVKGVNLDEEMVNLVASQRAYEASARLMTSIDEMLETLIMRTGVVGR